ncbi:hypothetical protein BH23ACT11_BH23ACT11_08320 [soil metagenome]
MEPDWRRPSSLRKLRIGLSVFSIILGLIMVAATFTPYGPSVQVGLVFGILLTAYGGIRLYWALRR